MLCVPYYITPSYRTFPPTVQSRTRIYINSPRKETTTLHIHPPMRMRAPPTPMTAPRAPPPAAAVSATRIVRLAVVARTAAAVVARDAVAVQPGQNSGEKEEDNVHDAKRKRGLEQRAVLVGVDGEKGPVGQEACVDVGAVGVGDEAEVVDAGYESAYDACFFFLCVYRSALGFQLL